MRHTLATATAGPRARGLSAVGLVLAATGLGLGTAAVLGLSGPGAVDPANSSAERGTDVAAAPTTGHESRTVMIPVGEVTAAGDSPATAPGATPRPAEIAPEDPVSVEAAHVVAESGDESPADGIAWFNGRPVRPVRTIAMRVTAYSPDRRSCGRFADGVTASGYSVWTNGMKLVAADTALLPFGTLISVPGYHDEKPVPVLDRGGRIKGRRLDVLFPTHRQARQWGVRHVDVTIWEYADGRPGDYRPRFGR